LTGVDLDQTKSAKLCNFLYNSCTIQLPKSVRKNCAQNPDAAERNYFVFHNCIWDADERWENPSDTSHVLIIAIFLARALG
jgi:hypothetical protein